MKGAFMKKEIIISKKAPAAIGPYSSALKIGNLVFVSGQLPIDPVTGEIVKGEIEAQARRSLENLKAVLESYSVGMENVVKTTIFLKDMNNFSRINEIYGDTLPVNFLPEAVWKYPVFPKMQI